MLIFHCAHCSFQNLFYVSTAGFSSRNFNDVVVVVVVAVVVIGQIRKTILF